jgi:hypothetical protein
MEEKKKLRRTPAALSKRKRLFVEKYLECWIASDAAVAAGYSERSRWEMGRRLMKDPLVQEALRVRIEDQVMTADEVLVRLANQARGDIGQFFKISERWTQNPFATEEIIRDEVRQVVVKGRNTEQTWYLVRSVVLDLEAVKDPNKSILIKKLVDNVKNGLSIEIYDAQSALTQIGKVFALFKDNLDLTSKGDRIVVNLVKDDDAS